MRRLIVLGLFAAVACAAGASGAASTTRTFDDTIGEDAAGPDITAVTASSDRSVLTFRVSIPTNPTVTPDFRLRIWLDADDSLETGLVLEDGPTGLDHFLIVDPTRFPADEARLYTCEGTVCKTGEGWFSVEFTYASGAMFTMNARSLQLERIGRVRFSVVVTTGIACCASGGYDFTNAHFDFAPDLVEEEAPQPMWTFDAQPLKITSFRAAPARAETGRPFTLTMGVQRAATGTQLSRGDVTCSLRIAGKRVTARTSRFVGRLATCEFAVPGGTRAKRYRATITVAAEDSTATRSVSGRVR